MGKKLVFSDCVLSINISRTSDFCFANRLRGSILWGIRRGLPISHVGFAFKPLVTHSEPPTAGEEPFAHKDFRQSVLRPDVTHAPMALLWAESVHIVKSQCSSRKLNPIEPSY